MGLDMYLQGHCYHGGSSKKTIDDFPVKEIILELGYWRKHPNLHGFIVSNFNDGTDDCQPIELGSSEIEQIIQAIENDELPPTSGFFFGTSYTPEHKKLYDEQKAEDIEVFRKALAWQTEKSEDVSFKYITYRASW